VLIIQTIIRGLITPNLGVMKVVVGLMIVTGLINPVVAQALVLQTGATTVVGLIHTPVLQGFTTLTPPHQGHDLTTPTCPVLIT
jgi:hypothetical protein